MKLQSKMISSRKFLLFATIYLVIGFVAFFLTTGGFSTLYFILGIGPVYLGVWTLFTFASVTSKRMRYTPLLVYVILLIQVIAILLNIADEGYYGITCRTKNFVQYLFDHSDCGGLWVSSEAYLKILALYALLLIFFAFDLLRLRSLHPEDR